MACDSVSDRYINTGCKSNLKSNCLFDMIAHDHVWWIINRLYKLSDTCIDWKCEWPSLGPPKRKLEGLILPWPLSYWSNTATSCSYVSANGSIVFKSVLPFSKAYKAMQPFKPLMMLMLKIFDILCQIAICYGPISPAILTLNSNWFALIVIKLLKTKFTHAMTAQLLCHVQNKVAII